MQAGALGRRTVGMSPDAEQDPLIFKINPAFGAVVTRLDSSPRCVQGPASVESLLDVGLASSRHPALSQQVSHGYASNSLGSASLSRDPLGTGQLTRKPRGTHR